ncbi:MAG: nucleoside deaminase [Burkholderiales bacterium]|nr:nucleoside deaminase [Burkholderiales bacterium]
MRGARRPRRSSAPTSCRRWRRARRTWRGNRGNGDVTPALDAADLAGLRLAIAESRIARRRGDMPYGAVLADAAGAILMTAQNTQVTERDLTGHAELNLLRAASRRFGPERLRGGTIFASGEPCAMCAGAIYWSGVARVVFALGAAAMHRLDPGDSAAALPDCRALLAGADRPIAVVGPVLEDEAEDAFLDRRRQPSTKEEAPR